MKKRTLRKIFSFTAALVVIFTAATIYESNQPSTVRAVGDLSIDWGVPSGNPIFVVTNMAPGDMEQKDVAVTNGATSIRPVGVRGVETSETGDLSEVLDLVI